MNAKVCFPISILLLNALFFAGCATGPTIQSQADPEADLSAYKTFTILPLPDRVPGADPGAMMPLKKPIEDQLRTSLTEIGMTETAAENADIAFNVRGEVVPKTKVTDWGYTYPSSGWGYSYPYYGYPQRDITVTNYDQVTLAIEGYDTETKDLVWVGWATDKTTSEKPADPAKVQQVVADILLKLAPDEADSEE